MTVNRSGRRVCDWCSVYVAAWMPDFTWYREFGPSEFVNGVWTQVGPAYGWTRPQSLCQSCAESAYDWRVCHRGVFAEVAP